MFVLRPFLSEPDPSQRLLLIVVHKKKIERVTGITTDLHDDPFQRPTLPHLVRTRQRREPGGVTVRLVGTPDEDKVHPLVQGLFGGDVWPEMTPVGESRFG